MLSKVVNLGVRFTLKSSRQNFDHVCHHVELTRYAFDNQPELQPIYLLSSSKQMLSIQTNFQKLKAGSYLGVLTGMWKFASIIVHRNTNRKEVNTKLGLAFSSVQRNYFNRDSTNFKWYSRSHRNPVSIAQALQLPNTDLVVTFSLGQFISSVLVSTIARTLRVIISLAFFPDFITANKVLTASFTSCFFFSVTW